MSTESGLVNEAAEAVTEEEASAVEPDYIEVHASELKKVLNTCRAGERHLRSLNEMNAALHLEDAVYSPLTTAMSNAVARLEGMLAGYNARLKEREDHGADA